MKLTQETKQVVGKNPVCIGIVGGYYFFEHPEHGDEAPLIMVSPEGEIVESTVHWEIPGIFDLFA